jgi:hypothetical protein
MGQALQRSEAWLRSARLEPPNEQTLQRKPSRKLPRRQRRVGPQVVGRGAPACLPNPLAGNAGTPSMTWRSSFGRCVSRSFAARTALTRHRLDRLLPMVEQPPVLQCRRAREVVCCAGEIGRMRIANATSLFGGVVFGRTSAQRVKERFRGRKCSGLSLGGSRGSEVIGRHGTARNGLSKPKRRRPAHCGAPSGYREERYVSMGGRSA